MLSIVECKLYVPCGRSDLFLSIYCDDETGAFNPNFSEVFVVSMQVPIMPGMRHEQRIPFRGQADELVG